MKLRRPGGARSQALGHRLAVLAMSLGAGLLLACDEAQPCYELGESCTDATGFSTIFESNVPCCEGTCTLQPPPPPPDENDIIRICE